MPHNPLKLSFKACPFYFSSCDNPLVLQSVLFKYVSHFEMFWPLPPSRHFEGRFHLQFCSTCSYQMTISTGFKAAFAGNCQRSAAFLCPPTLVTREKPLRPVVFLGYKLEWRASLVAQWLRICLLMQGTRVRALAWEDPTCRRAAGPVSHNC